MIVARTHEELRTALRPARASGASIGFVATMGAFHEGHLSLIHAAKERSDVVVVSIFVNPLQFNEPKDLAAYPRDEDRDIELARAEGCDVVFLPSVDEMYPNGSDVAVTVGPDLTEILEGESRRGHFDGVATVVAKLFNATRPDMTFFGQKDAQQVAVIRRLIDGLSYPIELVVCPTIREPDGVALSSRNVRLSSDERTAAAALYRALEDGARLMAKGRDPETVEKHMWETMVSAPGIDPDYARVVDPDTFSIPTGPRVLLVVAATVGPVRLIDNTIVDTTHQEDGSG
jgi:pantoate--beta-alanine ligase